MIWRILLRAFGRSASVPLRIVPERSGSTPGVNLVGYLAGEFGVAAASRTLARMIRAISSTVSTR